jgi:hypothetical protein
VSVGKSLDHWFLITQPHVPGNNAESEVDLVVHALNGREHQFCQSGLYPHSPIRKFCSIFYQRAYSKDSYLRIPTLGYDM